MPVSYPNPVRAVSVLLGIMGKGGQGVAPEEDIRSICWDEVKQHQKKGDSWIVIDGYVYDTSKFARRHPGGNVITHWAGQDATVSRKYSGFVHILLVLTAVLLVTTDQG